MNLRSRDSYSPTMVTEIGYGHFREVKNVLLSVVTQITIVNQIGTQIIMIFRLCKITAIIHTPRESTEWTHGNTINIPKSSLKTNSSLLFNSRFLRHRLLAASTDNNNGDDNNNNDDDSSHTQTNDQREVVLLLLTTTEVLGTSVLNTFVNHSSVQSSVKQSKDTQTRNNVRGKVDENVAVEAQMKQSSLIEMPVVVDHNSIQANVHTHQFTIRSRFIQNLTLHS